MSRKPNILWIMTDQQSFNMMGCAGNPYVETPNLDALAAQSVRFDRAYCTNPVCLPSRFSLFTGLYPEDIGVRSNGFWNESSGIPEQLLEKGLGRLLKEKGYTAVYGGKEHLPFSSAEGLGFDYLCKDEREVLADTCADYLRTYQWERPLCMVTSFINPHDICYMAIVDAAKKGVKEGNVPYEWFTSQLETIVMREAQKMPEGMSKEEFFANVCPPLPDNYEPAGDEPEAIAILQNERIFKQEAREHYTDEEWRLHRWTYAVLTKLVDTQIGRVLDALKESGHWDDTVILFTSDHGDMDASHKMEHKEALYEEACHVPLIIKGIGQTEAAANDQLICNGLDMIATVMDYSEIEKPEYIRGKSLRAIVEQRETEELRDIIVLECENGIGAVSKRYKYVCYHKGERNEQFYDLTVNPGENYNQIEEECYAEEVARFRETIKAHKENRPKL